MKKQNKSKCLLLILSSVLLLSCKQEQHRPIIGEEFTIGDHLTGKANKMTITKSVSVIDEKAAQEETVKQRNNYSYVNIEFTFISDLSTGFSYKFDKDDFKLKDHSGTKIQSNYFSTAECIPDYKWIGKEIITNEAVNFVVSFEVNDRIIEKDYDMYVEVDFSKNFFNGVDVLLRTNE